MKVVNGIGIQKRQAPVSLDHALSTGQEQMEISPGVTGECNSSLRCLHKR